MIESLTVVAVYMAGATLLGSIFQIIMRITDKDD